MKEEPVSGQCHPLVFFRVMGVPENILMAANVLWIGDECDRGMCHDQRLIRENIGDEANDLATLLLEMRIKLRVYTHQTHQVSQLLLIAQKVKPGQSWQLAIVKIDDLTSELCLHLLQNELRMQETIRKHRDLSPVTAVCHVLVKLTVDDHPLGQQQSTQLVHSHSSPSLLDLKHRLALAPLNSHCVIVLGK